MPAAQNVLFALGLFSVAGLAQATPIVLDGDHFSLAYDDAQVGVYRQGQLSGSLDTLYFLPTNFSVVTVSPFADTQAGLQFTLSIDPGYVFDGLAFTQDGNYFLSNAGQVGASASLQARDLGTSVTTTLALDSADALSAGGLTTGWALQGLLGAKGLDGARTLQISLDNSLTSEPVQGLGFIQSTYVGFRVQTRAHAVPEPSGLALTLVGGLAAVAAGRGLSGRRRST
ncbi:MAG: hypothetical protein ACYC5S_03520 [Thiobacillus sp.]